MGSGLERRLLTSIARTVAVVATGGALALASYAGTTSYTYDVHGRVKTVTTPNGSDQSVTTYTYDNTGNRSTVATTLSDTTAPNPPTNPTATALAFNQISLNWTTSQDVGGGPVAYYRVYRGGALWAQPNVPPFVDYPLTANTTYSYTVSAIDPSSNESAQTSIASATTPNGPDQTPPSVPNNLHGNATSGTTISLGWDASTDNPGGSGVAGYQVFRGGTAIGTTSSTTYPDTSLAPATTYQYQVRAYDAAQPTNYSGLSSQIPVTTPDTVPPSAPGAPQFSLITGSSATATWTPATDNVGVTGYRYSLNGGSSWTTVGGSSANLTGLTLGTQYTMLVQAGDGAPVPNWGPSSSASFTTLSSYTDNLSFVGSFTTDNSTWINTGYSSAGMGSLTPNTVSGGKTITQFTGYFNYTTFDMQMYLQVTGFSGNPGAAWLQSVSVSGLTGTITGSSAVFSCQSSTTCTWFWPSYSDLRGSGTMTIVHQ